MRDVKAIAIASLSLALFACGGGDAEDQQEPRVLLPASATLDTSTLPSTQPDPAPPGSVTDTYKPGRGHRK